MENNHAKGHAFRLNFKCTNNMAKYEALILGLQLVRKLGAKRVSILGDSEMIIKQISGEYSINNPRLGRYRDIVLDLIKDLLESNFAAIPRKQNMQAHNLATFASTCKFAFQPNHQYTIEVRHRPVIPNNLKYWHIFSQDSHIYDFMNNEGEFQNCKIDTDCTIDNDIESSIYVYMFYVAKPTKFTRVEIDSLENVEIEEIMVDEPEILNLKNNFLPKGLVPLEDLFDSNDVARKPKMEPLRADIKEVNIGTKDKPKLIKISKVSPLEEKVKYINLFKEFQDVFSWSYEDLKSYDTSVIQHKIPLKEDHKHFK